MNIQPALRIKPLITLLLLLCMTRGVHAQLYVGIAGGYNRNYIQTNNANRNFTNYIPGDGFSIGIPVQYQLADWFAIAADPTFIRKTYTQIRSAFYLGTYQTNQNNYLQLPLMGHFMFGGKQLKGFFNLGGYAGYWTSGRVQGVLANVLNPVDSVTATNTFFNFSNPYEYNENHEFNTTRDNRLELGWIAGTGISYTIGGKYVVFAEGRYIQAITDMQKKYMLNQVPRYNQTYNASIGVMMRLGKEKNNGSEL